jgi:spore germination protein YaaH
MMKKISRFIAIASALAASLVLGCSGTSGETTESVSLRVDTPLPARAGSVVVDGCVLDAWQRATLAGPGAHRVLQEIILLCLVPRLDGTIGPRDPSAQQQLAQLLSDLKQDGYRVHLGISFTDETGQRYDGAQTRTFLADPRWRQQFIGTLGTAIAPADGIELDLQKLPNDARQIVTAFVTEIAQTVRPGKELGVFVPPSVAVPSDLPGGEAFDRAALAAQVDRVRVMTLDFSDMGPGPTIDPGWAVLAARTAKGDARAVDIAYPLYGTDFGPRGRRSTTYLEAIATASNAGVPIQHGPTTAPYLRYTGYGGEAHEMWFDDADSTGHALAAWTYDVLPPDVGVVFYGLGAEEPNLFERLGARMP